MSDALLTVEDLIIEFDTPQGRRRVVDGVTLTVGHGEVLGVLGESGSGKTMTTRAVLGLVDGSPGVVGGRICFDDDGTPVELLAELDTFITTVDGQKHKKQREWDSAVDVRMRPMWGRTMTAVFQNPRHSLDPLLTAGAQVEESIALAFPGLSRDELRERAIDWLDQVQMTEPARVYGCYPHELSGGMCQRAMIAVALAREPKLLIADEPTTGLDTTVRAEIVEIFRQLIEEQGRSMLYISHDVREVLYLANRVIVMRNGKVVEIETADNLRKGIGVRAEYTAMLLGAADLPTGEGRHD